MGYTHYWKLTEKPSADEWQAFTESVKRLLEQTEVVAPAEITGEYVEFNGVKPDDYETFSLEAEPTERFTFCKTQKKPYDLYVVAVLHLAELHFGPDRIEVSSDGDEGELKPGRELAAKVYHAPAQKAGRLLAGEGTLLQLAKKFGSADDRYPADKGILKELVFEAMDEHGWKYITASFNGGHDNGGTEEVNATTAGGDEVKVEGEPWSIDAEDDALRWAIEFPERETFGSYCSTDYVNGKVTWDAANRTVTMEYEQEEITHVGHEKVF